MVKEAQQKQRVRMNEIGAISTPKNKKKITKLKFPPPAAASHLVDPEIVKTACQPLAPLAILGLAISQGHIEARCGFFAHYVILVVCERAAEAGAHAPPAEETLQRQLSETVARGAAPMQSKE